MQIKFTVHFLSKLEGLFAESDFILRYEKGKFHSGYCILNENKIVIVNKYFPLEGRINSLIEILRSIKLDASGLSEKNRNFYHELNQMEFKL